MSLFKRHILLGVTGGIAAYKAAELARLLVKAGAEVQVVMTASAREFIGPMTFQALTGREVRSELFDEEHEAAMGHIELARWADLVIVAPATADFIARISAGRADDLLTTLCLATDAQVALAPAMNQRMWVDAATESNLEVLQSRDFLIWGPADGEQACGEVGLGRMLEAADLSMLVDACFPKGVLDGLKALVTAGPTREAIDPVRFIGNRSSGRMGFEIAAALAEQGAEVTLVAGPVALDTPERVVRLDVESAIEMHAAVMAQIEDQDLFVAVAAVSDYRPSQPAPNKIKKSKEELDISLIKNPDILAEVAARTNPPFTVGFAAETDDVENYARRKLVVKDIDMIAANRVGGGAGGFESADNALSLIWREGGRELPMTTKERLARQLVEVIGERFHARTATENT